MMRRLPHLVLDGAIAAATALGSDRIVIALDEHAREARQTIVHAISERFDLSARNAQSIELAWVPRGYLTGQETALVNVLGGGPPKPTLRPPYMFERGLKGRPTLVCNTETYAHIGLVARHGADWYRELGSASAPGTRLVTVGGSVSYPGVVEIAGGTSLARLIEASGGLTEPLGGVLLGGYAGTWLGPEAVELVLDEQALHQHGIRLGAGIVFILPRSACVVSEVARVAGWLLAQSAHQCGPCEFGLGAIARALTELTGPDGDRGGYRQIERWCGLVIGRGACALPDGAAGFITSALHTFRPAFDDHARHGACEACYSSRLLPTAQARSAIRS
jgi:NADH:ubiquinone oxidoreductase subunit F (NADH-binding)